MKDQLFDHYAVEYEFPDGTRLFAQGRHIANCWGFFGDVIHGAKGSAVLGEGMTDAALYKGFKPDPGAVTWQYKGTRGEPVPGRARPAVRGHPQGQALQRIAALRVCRHDRHPGPHGRRVGQLITWDEAMASNLELAPGLESYTMESEPPVKPDANGNYPVAMPGVNVAY